MKSLSNTQADSLKEIVADFGDFNFEEDFDLRNLNLYQTDSLLNLLEQDLMFNFEEFNRSNDVKFYMTPDSLMSQMKEDTLLDFDFIENTTVSFLDENGNKDSLNSYNSYDGSVSREDFVEPEVIIVPSIFALAVDVKDVSGLFFTVQIGVYANPVTPDVLLNITPLYSQTLDNGYIRYTTGVFEDESKAIILKDDIVKNKNVVDAYVTAYYNGVRVKLSEAKALLEEHGPGILFSADANVILNKGKVFDETKIEEEGTEVEEEIENDSESTIEEESENEVQPDPEIEPSDD